MDSNPTLAPGARVIIRDEEWLIRRVDPSTDGGWLLTCDGISDLVRSQKALFLTALEDHIEVLDPAATGSFPTPARCTTPHFCTWKVSAGAPWPMTTASTWAIAG